MKNSNNNQTVIKDNATNTYYCVKMTRKNSSGEPTAGDEDFPYWSNNIEDAYDFGSVRLAEHEMNCNDLTDGGTRQPNIITIVN